MYSDKENINILTSLLVSHGVRHIVVCPGSRNGALVHDFNECPGLICHPVTDERSAGFIALGLRQRLHEKVAVCVTSGSALLNLLPAVAEATYQHCGIIVISADRPAAWIGQRDGQTLPQEGALGQFVSFSATLPEPHDGTESWECNRKANEALLEAARNTGPSVHINVPVSEPLFNFTVPELPQQRCIRRVRMDGKGRNEVLDRILSAARPMVVTGQCPYGELPSDVMEALDGKIALLRESLSSDCSAPCFTDQMLFALSDMEERYKPDCVVYLGGNTVSKRLRRFLRNSCNEAFHIVVSDSGKLHDVSCRTEMLVDAGLGDFVCALNESIDGREGKRMEFKNLWAEVREKVAAAHRTFNPGFSQMAAVKLLEENTGREDCVHCANSMSVRLDSIWSHGGYRYCNRGLNGIEGSLSTAAGSALAMKEEGGTGKVYCICGDLSFFYDENAMWQTELDGRLRILLLNNGQGGIFRSLPGLENSPVRDSLIAGAHSLDAEGICFQFKVRHLIADDMTSLETGIRKLCASDSDRPVLLEVFTRPDDDRTIYDSYLKHIAYGMD